jgi:hypothetical protein
VLLALVAAWVAAITLPFLSPVGFADVMSRLLSALVFASVVVAAIKWCRPSKSFADAARPQASLCAVTG